MADAVLFDVVTEIIKALGSQVFKEIGQWWGFNDELENLKRTFSTIEPVLLHAEELCLENSQVKGWLGNLKEAIYDADDLLDEISTVALQHRMAGNRRRKQVRLFFSSSNRFAYGLKMAPKIKAIRDLLKEISANRNFILEERYVETLGVTKRPSREQTHSSAPQLVVGREDDKQKIIELLLSSHHEENVSTIPIVGIGGLGKTTLAQCVFDDERVKKHFELRSWVCISDNFDVELTVRRILESASRKKPESTVMDPLKNLLHDTINGNRFLIVLDDLWSDDREKWFRLKDLLAGGARGSKVVITTRLRKVAETTRPIYIHQLQGLSEVESWSLFKQIAFKQGQVPSPTFEAIGKKIVERLLGVPLAIKTIGGVLYFKDSESEWLSFKEKELSKVDQHETDILPTLKLSYNHLPSHLKHCFACCRLFPKDYEINVELLVHLWMAQGYVVSSDPNQCLEDIGNEYFVDLHWGSFFQEVRKDDFGNIETCKMHDLMHDLAMLVAGEECVISNTDMADISSSSRHISFECGQGPEWKFSSSLSKGSKARTFLVLNGEVPPMKEEKCSEIFESLRCLRVLELNFLQMRTLPPSIGKLKHLRFLDLSSNRDLVWLPDSITKLHNLQVLKLSGCSSLMLLPMAIKNLVNLTHLDNWDCDRLICMPRGIGQLTRLTKLSRFVIAENDTVSSVLAAGGLDELGGLNLLRGTLRIDNLREVKDATFECKAANLKQKCHLQHLFLSWNYYDDDSGIGEEENNEMALEALEPHQYLKALTLQGYMGVKLPSWLSSLTVLVRILLFSCPKIKCLPPFDQLLSLKQLTIWGLSNLEYIESGLNSSVNESSSFFPSLEILSLNECPNLKGWNINEKAESLQFPHLSILAVISCPNLTFMPLSPSLNTLHCDGMFLTSEYSSSSSSFPYSLFPLLSQLEKLIITANGQLNIISESTRTADEDSDDKLLWERLKSLRDLLFSNLPKLASLPKGLQHLTTLRSLTIFSCPDLESFSNEPECLTSCHTISIDKCPKLMSLPDWMLNLAGVQFLQITESPQLAERCKDKMAPDWPKISHIPNIQIHNKWIQRNRSYQL